MPKLLPNPACPIRALWPFVFALVNLMATGFLSAQAVYVEEYPSQADVKLYRTNTRSEADIIVYRVPYRNQAEAAKGRWYEVTYRSQAEWRIYWVPYRSQADCVVYFTKYRSEGRRNACFFHSGSGTRHTEIMKNNQRKL